MKTPWEVATDVWMMFGRLDRGRDLRRTVNRAWHWVAWGRPVLKWIGVVIAVVGLATTIVFVAGG